MAAGETGLKLSDLGQEGGDGWWVMDLQAGAGF